LRPMKTMEWMGPLREMKKGLRTISNGSVTEYQLKQRQNGKEYELRV